MRVSLCVCVANRTYIFRAALSGATHLLGERLHEMRFAQFDEQQLPPASRSHKKVDLLD